MRFIQVLILILMEHAQRGKRHDCIRSKCNRVLILILMEHAQRDIANNILFKDDPSLNPYFNGTCSKRAFHKLLAANNLRLNPYFNGTCSKSKFKFKFSNIMKQS